MPEMTQTELYAQELSVALARITQLEELHEKAGEAMKITDRAVAWDPAAECFAVENFEPNEKPCFRVEAESLERALSMIVKLGE